MQSSFESQGNSSQEQQGMDSLSPTKTTKSPLMLQLPIADCNCTEDQDNGAKFGSPQSPRSPMISPLSPRRQRAREREKMVEQVVKVVSSPVPYVIFILLVIMIIMIFVDIMPIASLICIAAIVMVLTVVLGNHWRDKVIWQRHHSEQVVTKPSGSNSLLFASVPLSSESSKPILSTDSQRSQSHHNGDYNQLEVEEDEEKGQARSNSLKVEVNQESNKQEEYGESTQLVQSTFNKTQQLLEDEMPLKDSNREEDLGPMTKEDKLDNLNEFFEDLFKSIDYSLLFIFLGTFIVIETVASTGIPRRFW
jgi:hypothetical protein